MMLGDMTTLCQVYFCHQHLLTLHHLAGQKSDRRVFRNIVPSKISGIHHSTIPKIRDNPSEPNEGKIG